MKLYVLLKALLIFSKTSKLLLKMLIQNPSNKSRICLLLLRFYQILLVRGSTNSSLHLLQLTLPEFTGQESLNWFAEQLTNVLASSGVSAKFWFTYLKQQCHKDAWAFHIICHYETAHASKLNEKDPMMSIWSFMTSASPISLHNGMFQRNSKFASFFQCIIP